MRIVSPKGNPIATMEEWSSCVRPQHWKEGRSAYSLADFMLNREGSRILEDRISRVLNQPVDFEQATPEFRAKFDCYRGSPSNLDLGIAGRVGSGCSLFVGLEAKVDEGFGDKTVCQRHQSAVEERIKNPRSNAAARIERLLSHYFSEESSPCVSAFSDIGYQLLTGTAGTVATKKDVVVFYVMAFETHSYDKEKGWDNRIDYENFIQATKGNLRMKDGGRIQRSMM